MVRDESNAGGAPTASPGLNLLAGFCGAGITLMAVIWAADLPRYVGFVPYTEQFLAATLALALALVFLRLPAGGGRRLRLPWYDVLAAAAGLAASGYVAWSYPQLVNDAVSRPLHLVVLGTVLVLLLLEGLRRSVGLPLVIVTSAFILYALLGDLIPGRLAGRPIAVDRLAVYLGIDANAIFGTPLIVGVVVVVPFLLLGQLLSRSGGSDFFTDLAISLMGRYRGGSAKIAIIASAFFGMISGSAVSNVMTVGVITIPLMRKAGYKARLAGAVEAVGSTGGQLMPPVMGAAAFLMAEFLQVSYATVCLAALVPAVLYYLSLFIQVDLEAARANIAAVQEMRKPLRQVLAEGWHVPLPFVALVVALFGFNQQPETAVLVALVPLLLFGMILGYGGRRLRLRDLLPAVRETGASALDMILICAAAGIVIGVLNLSGLGFSLTMILVALGKGSLLVLLLAAAAISLILGMGMPTVGVYVLVATLVAPAMIEMGVAPIAAHMFVLYFGMMSMITPPVALAAFAAASVARADPMKVGWTSCRIAWSAFLVPFLFVASPNLLMQGNAIEVALAAVTAVFGIWAVSVGVVGWLGQGLTTVYRGAFGLAGLLLLIPAKAFPGALWTDVIGGLAIIGLMVLRLPRLRSALQTTTRNIGESS